MPTLKVRHVLTKDSSLVLQNDQLRREIQTLNNQTLIQYPLRVLRLMCKTLCTLIIRPIPATTKLR